MHAHHPMPLRHLIAALAVASLCWLSACDTTIPQPDSPQGLLLQAEELRSQARVLTDQALFISSQGITPQRSFQLAYAGLHGDKSLDEFSRSFDRAVRASALASTAGQAQVTADPSAAESFVREFGAEVADVQDADRTMTLAEAAMDRAERHFSGDTLQAVQEWVAFTYTVQRYITENTWKVMLMAAYADGDVASNSMWDGWRFSLTQSGGSQSAPDDPPNPDAYAPSRRDNLDRILEYSALMGTAGAGIGAGVAGLPTVGFGAPAGAAVGGAIGIVAGAALAAFTNGGGSDTREYRIALDNWCNNTNNRSHVDHDLLCNR